MILESILIAVFMTVLALVLLRILRQRRLKRDRLALLRKFNLMDLKGTRSMSK